MFGKITNDVVESYLKCRYKTHLKAAGGQSRLHDYEILMKESREQVRQAAIQLLLSTRYGKELAIGESLNLGLLQRGLPLLLDSKVEHEDLSTRIDALVRVEGSSALGKFHYQPVIFHEVAKPGADIRMLLAISGVILSGIQDKEPASGVLFHGPDCQRVTVKLASLFAPARRLLQEIREARSNQPPKLLLNAHCHVCEFRQQCQTEAESKDDLSRLRSISEKEINKYAKRGIFTVTQLSFTFRARRGRPYGRQKQVHQHALKALAIREKKIHILGAVELPTSPIRIYFDIEGDPDRGFDYLLGLVVVTDAEEHRHSIWADSAADEPRILQQFLDIVGGLVDAWIYTYGSYEADFLRRVGKSTGRDEEVSRVLKRTFNVLSVIYSQIYFPVYSNGLKEIGTHLGCTWSESDASGILSIVWRRRWEATGSTEWKDKLITYNIEDCSALRKVTELLYATCSGRSIDGMMPSHDGHTFMRVAEITNRSGMHGWNESIHGVSVFDYIHERASFDYLKDRVCARSGKRINSNSSGKRTIKWKKNRTVNRETEISSPVCPDCGSNLLDRRPNRSLARLAFDLRITRSGIRSVVTRYRTAWHHCLGCGKRFLPPDYLRLEEFCHCLKSWAMYEHVSHRASLPSIADTLKECFNLPICHSQTHAFKGLLARFYATTYKQLLKKLVAGHVIHADETEVQVRRLGRAYVWVFTNLEEVVYMYQPSREGEFLHEVLKDFRGVVVSDFYAAYDSLKCSQQKCIIHLLRDFNQDILANPWDEELKSVAGIFGGLLKSIIATVDLYGLRQRHLGKHRRDIDRFFDGIAKSQYRSEAAEAYRQRLLKCRDKLFTFIGHDGVPWNNNAAEHAVKAFARYREVADSMVSDTGLAPYLVLLSIQQTCKRKGISFLKFLISREIDIDAFQRCPRNREVPAIELYPEGSESDRPSRKRLQP